MKLTSDKLVKKWAQLLESEDLPKIRDGYRRKVTAQLLENQEEETRKQHGIQAGYGELNEAPANVTGSNVLGYDPILIALVRRAMPNLMAYDVCGVQPLSGPTGLIFAIKSKYSTQGGTEALFNEANSAFSGKGAQAGTDPTSQGNSTAYKPGTGMTTAEAEALGDGLGTNFAQMAFSIDRVSVTAASRGLKAEYAVELAQDLKALHGLDAEGELANILTNEILSEINREVIRTIYNNAIAGCDQPGLAVAGEFDMDIDANGRWSVEKFKGLIHHLYREANAIAFATKRGSGNILIVSGDVAAALSSAGLLDSNNALSADLADDGITASPFVGTLNGKFKVFVDPYTNPNIGFYVVGYKGASAYDAGLFFAPYVPLTMYKAVDPKSMQPVIAFKTRYGMVANPFATSAGDGALSWKSNVYYRRGTIKNL